jgi:hypothetical protein
MSLPPPYLGTHDENVGENVQILAGSCTTKVFPSARALALMNERQLGHISLDTAKVSDNKRRKGDASIFKNRYVPFVFSERA